MVIALLAATAAFVSITALMAWASGLVRNPAEARLSRLQERTAPSDTPDAPFSDRVFIPLLDGIVHAILPLLPHAFVLRTRRQLLSAGDPLTVQGFFTIVVVCAIVFPAAGLFVASQATSGSAGTTIIATVLAGTGGILLPFVWLRRRVRSRKAAIWKSLADAFDLITVSVEAGLGLDAALRQVAAKLKGPLADEISLSLRQIGMGRPRREALEDLANRVDVTEVTTFVNAIVQAEQLGTSLGRVLRAQSVTLRIHRRQRAEETARRAPVKMVFPLVLFIMPTFFIITIGPVFVHLVEYLND
ncbi:MAG TPA: type II secretion system F family protein [Dehalococcoidia bacterium]|nr:type II secretion system F family protein [Dehalococcoidia bacterium]